MIALTPFHMQVAGIVVLVLVTLGAGWWVVRRAMGWHRGRPVYFLGDTVDDDDDGDDGGSGDND